MQGNFSPLVTEKAGESRKLLITYAFSLVLGEALRLLGSERLPFIFLVRELFEI